ncbi:hypothetical protein CTI12_AA352180 [Artemisia annua]|uniref:Uncharacterized protein n=1 Tax=Artemisia annua TaxID=35608 RepID=A0A2U1MMW7_ARTAN|nr:hypothetical protein CTI12_AA352180 [Artemisia annua]
MGGIAGLIKINSGEAGLIVDSGEKSKKPIIKIGKGRKKKTMAGDGSNKNKNEVTKDRSVPEKFIQIVAAIEQFADLNKLSFQEAMGRLKAFEEWRKKGVKEEDGSSSLLFSKVDEKEKTKEHKCSCFCNTNNIGGDRLSVSINRSNLPAYKSFIGSVALQQTIDGREGIRFIIDVAGVREECVEEVVGWVEGKEEVVGWVEGKEEGGQERVMVFHTFSNNVRHVEGGMMPFGPCVTERGFRKCANITIDERHGDES